MAKPVVAPPQPPRETAEFNGDSVLELTADLRCRPCTGVTDYVLWFGKNHEQTKYRPLFGSKELGEDGAGKYNRVRLPTLERRSLTSAERGITIDTSQATLEPLREHLNTALKQRWEEWEIPRHADDKWPEAAKELHAEWWKQCVAPLA